VKGPATAPGAGRTAPPAAEPEPLPAPGFRVLSAAHDPQAAAPTLVFDLEIEEPSGHPVYSIALSCQVQVEPARRGHDPATRERLVDLFGPPESWAGNLANLYWFRRDVLVRSFTGRTTVPLSCPCTYDLEVGSTRYFEALGDGEVPLSFTFTGTVFYAGKGGRLQMVQVPWDRQARFALPVAAWRRMIDHHYPASAWVRVDRDTAGALRRFQVERGLPSFDACLRELLATAASERDDGDER
jgi:hypothetical protein